MRPLVFEKDLAGAWRLTTADLNSVRTQLGEEVLVSFCRAYVYADRLDSLIDMYEPVLRKHGIASAAVRAQRNWITFFALAAGSLKELSLVLGDLRAALVKRGIWDQSEWESGLKAWEVWGSRSDVSSVRNQLAFHVDRTIMEGGLAAVLKRGAPNVVLYAGDGPDLKNSWFRLAHDILFAGAIHGFGVGSAEKLYDTISGMLGVIDHLDHCWGMSLVRAGLQPEVISVGRGALT
jgi:hypothetical protein